MTLAWVDEFNGTTLDPTRWEDTGLWYAKGDYSPDGHNGDIARPSQVNVTGGNLVLSATRRAISVDGVTYPWIDGFVDTAPNDINPGFRIRAPFYAEVCAKLPPVSPGEWPSIVMYQSPINGATQYAEMDLLERVGAPATAFMSFHPAGSAPGTAEQIDPSIDLSAAFHTYGIYVDPSGNIQYYFDGAALGSVIPGGANAMEPMFMTMGMTVGGVPDDGWAGIPMYFTPSPVQMLVGYMRVWRGTPTP